MVDLETEVKLLKKELEDQKKIHDRLDIAIEKLTDVSNSIHRMLAVHEEKITRQEEEIETRRVEVSSQLADLHSRVTTNTKEIMAAAASQQVLIPAKGSRPHYLVCSAPFGHSTH